VSIVMLVVVVVRPG